MINLKNLWAFVFIVIVPLLSIFLGHSIGAHAETVSQVTFTTHRTQRTSSGYEEEDKTYTFDSSSEHAFCILVTHSSLQDWDIVIDSSQLGYYDSGVYTSYNIVCIDYHLVNGTVTTSYSLDRNFYRTEFPNAAHLSDLRCSATFLPSDGNPVSNWGCTFSLWSTVETGSGMRTIGRGQTISFDTLNNVPFFSDPDDCYDYLYSGDDSNATDEDGSPLVDIDPGGQSDDETLPDYVPVPDVQWVEDSEGNFRTLQFNNRVYANGRGYGLELNVNWITLRDFTLTYKGFSGTKSIYTVTYSDILSDLGTHDLGYSLPSSTAGYTVTPGTINFLTVEGSSDIYNALLSTFPVADRNITADSTFTTNAMRQHLSSMSCPYNAVIVKARYYRYKDGVSNTIIYGDWNTVNSPFPEQGAQLKIDKSSGEVEPPDPDPTPDPEPDDLDLGDLEESIRSIFSFLGEFPSFLSQLFGFLPEWVPILIAILIALSLLIGLVKLIF